MPILEYYPPKKIVIDKSNSNGDYYKASCECCGAIFFPKRNTAKYCSPNCKVIQHRIETANGIYQKISEKTQSKSYLKKTRTIRGASGVYKFLKSKIDVWGQKEEILNTCKYCEIGKDWGIGKYNFRKISTQVFEVF